MRCAVWYDLNPTTGIGEEEMETENCNRRKNVPKINAQLKGKLKATVGIGTGCSKVTQRFRIKKIIQMKIGFVRRC
jgi:hypothetical protein